jgi:hypothetical protein
LPKYGQFKFLQGQTNYSLRSQLCVRQGIWKTSSPELLLTEDTKDKKIFCCSSVFGQPDM